MRNRFAAIWIALLAAPFVWLGLCAPLPALIPFTNGISLQAYSESTASAMLLARAAAGTYMTLQFAATAPYPLFGGTDTLNQLLSGGGWKSLLAAAAGPAGAGRQSQLLAFADLTNNGLL